MTAAIQSMTTLNRRASELLVEAGSVVHAVTDITGFGLLGHAWEMAAQSLTNMHFDCDALPLLPHVYRYAADGCIPGGTRRNERALQTYVHFDPILDEIYQAVLFDPQTSGGLFAAIDPALWETFTQQEEVKFWRIGEVTEPVSDQALLVLEVKG
jgi:selenide, water dikinase